MYKWIEATTMLKISSSQLQTKVEEACFKDDEMCKIEEVIRVICD